MKKSMMLAISILIALFGMTGVVQDAWALDGPHNTNKPAWNITCSRCHYSPTGTTPTWATLPTTTDDTFKNNLCVSCHSASGMPLADPRFTDVKTHSATQTGSSYWSGAWTVECTTCHSPHNQQMATSATFSAEAGVNVVTGTVTAVTTAPSATLSSLTDGSKAFTNNQWVGYLLIPNVNYPTRVYRIASNSATVITVDGAINPNYAPAGAMYTIRYGKMVNSSVSTPNSGIRAVKFFNATGANSFGDGSTAATTGVCQVCHTQTVSFRNDGTREGAGHPAGVAGVQPCTDCHSHKSGFKVGGCTECHGSPPDSSANLIFKSRLSVTVVSDSPGPGAHVKHTSTAGYDCARCHASGMLGGDSQGDDRINIKFNLGSTDLGGNYDGKPGRTVYPYLGGAPTTVTTGNTLQCSNLYCHSTVQAANGGAGAPTYRTPSWTGTVVCGDCHNSDGVQGNATLMSTGSHTKHLAPAVGGTCDTCHSGATHANRSIDVTSGTYSMGGNPGNGFGSCSAAACHANVYAPSLVMTPAWGSTGNGCSACHSVSISATGPNTGGHAAHNEPTCTKCHNAGTTATAAPTSGHADGDIDIAVVGYPANVAKHAAGSGYATCSTASCHSDPYGPTTSVTPTWGTSGNGCAACHSAYPMQAYGPNTGGHALHNEPLCTKCHSAGTTATTKPTTSHADGDIDIAVVGYPANVAKHAAGSGYTTCSAASCHANVYGAGTAVTPTWGTSGNGCSACHSVSIAATGPNTGGHALHNEPLCTKCHSAGTTATTKPTTSHADGDIDIANVGYLANVAKHAAGSGYTTCSAASCHSNVYGAGTAVTPTWGTSGNGCSACHSVSIAATGPNTGGHALHNEPLCTKCHSAGTTATTKPTTSHADGDIDIANVGYLANVAKHAAGSGYTTCSAASCHSNVYGAGTAVTPTWGTTGNGCNACHSIAIAATGPNTGSHAAHNMTTCTNCHNAGTTAASKPTTSHADGDIDITGGYPANVAKHAAGSYTGSCSATACHGSNSPVWGANYAAYDTCTKCHGTKTATVNAANRYVVAPPLSVASTTGNLTGTGLVSDLPNVGAHQTHLQLFNGLTTTQTIDERCQNCHGTLPTLGTHANGVSAPTFTSLATKFSAMSPTYVGTTCNNTYCHNPAGTGGTLVPSSAGTGTAPVWTNAGYIADGTLKTAANCGVCHKVPESPVNPLWQYSTTHSSYNIGSACTSCHGHEGSGATHIDGIRQASGTCDSCHGYSAASWASATERAVEGKGAHAKHVAHLVARWGGTLNASGDSFGSGASWTNVCGVCHGGATHNMSEAVGGNGREITVSTALQFGPSAPVYAGVPATSSAANPKNCSNVSCHFQTTPVWSSY